MTYNRPDAPLIATPMRSQQVLGTTLTTRDMLSIHWLYALQYYPPDKLDQNISHVIVGISKHIFFPPWATRNEISHSDKKITNNH